MYKKYCPNCQTDRTVDINDAFQKKMTRVICGHCGYVLLASKKEIENLWWQYYGGCCS